MSWRTVNLGELVDNYSVRAKDHSADTSSLEFCGVSNNLGITLSKYAAEDKADDYKIIEKDCFAYNPYRINVGSIGLLESDTVGLISPAYVVFKPKPKSIIPQLLLKFLKSSEGLRQIKMHARGTVRQALRFEDLCKIELSIPDYDSQLEFFKRIEATEIETSVLNNELEHQLSLVKQLRHAFMRDAMQGKLVPQDPTDEPASVLLEKIKAEKEQLIKEKKIKKEKPLPPISDDEIPFEIPKNWVWCRLGEVAQIKRGTGPKYSEKGVFKMLNQKCVRWFIIQIEYCKAIDENWYNTLNDDFKISPNDLLVNSTGDGTIGRSGLAGDDCIGFVFDSHILRVRTYSEINHSLICSIINSDYGQGLIESIKGATSTKQTELGVSNLSNFPIPLTPLAEQQRIVSKLGELMKMCDDLEASIKESQQQNEALLQQVLREALEPK